MTKKEIAAQIVQMNDDDVIQVLLELAKQWETMRPGYELFVIAVPVNDPEEQKRIVEHVVRSIDQTHGNRVAVSSADS